MAIPDSDRYISGKQLLPRLAVGCLIFMAAMGFGTYMIARLATPYLRARNAEYLRNHRPPESSPSNPKR